MKYYQLSNTHYRVSAIGMGCMRIANKSAQEVEEMIDTALDCGINFFDHADIYGGGKSEEVFGEKFRAGKPVHQKNFPPPCIVTGNRKKAFYLHLPMSFSQVNPAVL